MPDFRILVDSDDVSRFCDADTVYCLKRNRDFSLIVPGLNISMSQDSTTVPEEGDIVLIYYGTDIIFYGFIDNVKDANDGTDYDIQIIHYLEKLKDHKIDHDTIHTALAAGTQAQYYDTFYDGHYVQLTWLVEVLMNLIKGTYSVTVNGAAKEVFTGINFEDIFFDEEMLYAVGQSGAADHSYWDDEDHEDYYPLQDNKVSAFDLLSELTSIFKIYIYFWNDFVVDIESNLDQYSFHKSLRWKRESRNYHAPNNNTTVKVQLFKDLSKYNESTLTDELDDNSFYGDDESNRNFKSKSLINNLCFFLNMKATDDIAENGGFETWTVTDPDDWTIAGDGMVSKETTIVHGGLNAVKMSVYYEEINPQIYQVIDLNYIPVYGKIVFWKYHIQNNLEILIAGWKDGAWIAVADYDVASNLYSWKEDDGFYFTIPWGVTRLKVAFRRCGATGNTEDVYIDDVEIYLIQAPINEYAVSLMDVYARDYSILDVETELDTVIRRAQEIGFDIAEQKKVIVLDSPEGDAAGFPYTLPLEFTS